MSIDAGRSIRPVSEKILLSKTAQCSTSLKVAMFRDGMRIPSDDFDEHPSRREPNHSASIFSLQIDRIA